MSDIYIESRLQAIIEIASTSCQDSKDVENIRSFCSEINDHINNIVNMNKMNFNQNSERSLSEVHSHVKYEKGDKIKYLTNRGERYAEIIGYAGEQYGFRVYNLQSLSKYKNKFQLTEEEIHGFMDGYSR